MDAFLSGKIVSVTKSGTENGNQDAQIPVSARNFISTVDTDTLSG